MFNFFGTKNTVPQIDDHDLKVTMALQEAGSDLTKIHSVDFFLYLPSQETAQLSNSKIQEKYPEFIPKIEASESTSEWVLTYQAKLVPELETMREIRSFFDQVVSEYGGDYDGWGASIEK